MKPGRATEEEPAASAPPPAGQDRGRATEEEPADSAPPRAGRRDRLAAAFAPLVGAFVGAFLGCVRMTSFDLPLMVASGERLLATGEVPATNPWHWPNPGFPWLDDKWGFGLLCAAAERAGGGAALTALNALLGAAAGALLFVVLRRRTGAWTAAGVATAAVTLLSYRAMLRAEWISYLGVAWMLLHVEGVLAGRLRSAALVVAAVPLWAACHVYWVLAPALLLVASLAALSWRGAVAAVAAFLAGAVSPYGLANVAHPFRIARTAREFEGAIAELRAPFGDGPFTYLHLLAVVLAVLTIWGMRGLLPLAAWERSAEGPLFGGRIVRAGLLRAAPERRAACAVALVLLVAAFRYDRNLPLVALAYVAVAAAETGRDRLRWTAALAAPAAVGLAAGVAWLAPERTLGVGWDERAFPWRLVASLGPETREHRYANDFSLGSFLDWERGSSFVDGNTHGYPPEHFALYRSALEGTTSVADVDRRHPNDGWLLRTSAPHTRVLVVGLFLEGDYAPTDADDVATLFRAEPDPERADALWRAWLAERYLPHARAWFPSREEAVAAHLGGRAPANADEWRRLVVASPWEREFLDGLRRAYDASGATRQAARIWRLARRLGD